MSERMESIFIFVSYAYKDQGYYKEFSKHFSIYKKRWGINVWHEGKIIPGDSQEIEIMKQLDNAQLILLLISADYLDTSSHIIQRAMELKENGKAVVIPIYIRPTDIEGLPINALQGLPSNKLAIAKWSSKDDAYVDVTKGIKRILTEVFSLHLDEPSSFDKEALSSQPEVTLNLMPLIDPYLTVQRIDIVEDIYAQLTQTNINALVLTGIGGAGKSTLAALVYDYVEKKYQTTEALYFQQPPVWISLHANSTVYDLVTSILQALDVDTTVIGKLPTPQQIQELYRTLQTTEQTKLIIIDQFEDLLDTQTGHAHPEHLGVEAWLDALNKQHYRPRFLFVSRIMPQVAKSYNWLYIQEKPIPSFQLKEGIALLQKRDVEANSKFLKKAVDYCQGHALSLSLLALLLNEDQSLDLPSLINNEENQEIWKEKIAQELLEHIFQEQLSEEQKALLSALSIYREPIPLQAARVVLETLERQNKTISALHASSQVLMALSLLQAVGNGCYQPHSIVADYARDHFYYRGQENQTNNQVQQQAHQAAANYYTEIAINKQNNNNASTFEGRAHAYIEAVWHLCKARQWKKAYELLEQPDLFSLLQRQGKSLLLFDLYQSLLQALEWEPTDDQKTTLSSHLGDIYRTLGNAKQAQPYLLQALELSEQAKENGATSQNLAEKYIYNWTLNNLGRTYRMQGQDKTAQTYFERALAFSQEVGNKADEATTLNELANIYTKEGNPEQSINYHEQALTLSRELGDPGKESTTLKFLAEATAYAKQKKQALNYYEQALRLQRKTHMRREEGKTLRSLGAFYFSIGQHEKAIEHDQKAIDILQQVGDHVEEGKAFCQLGRAYAANKQNDAAFLALKEAFSIEHSLNTLEQESTVLEEIGTLYMQQEHYRFALACYLQAEQNFDATQTSSERERDNLAKKINALQKKVGKKSFINLRDEVEPDTAQIVKQALDAIQEQH